VNLTGRDWVQIRIRLCVHSNRGWSAGAGEVGPRKETICLCEVPRWQADKWTQGDIGSDWKGEIGVRKGGRRETNLLMIRPGVILGRTRGPPPPHVASKAIS